MTKPTLHIEARYGVTDETQLIVTGPAGFRFSEIDITCESLEATSCVRLLCEMEKAGLVDLVASKAARSEWGIT